MKITYWLAFAVTVLSATADVTAQTRYTCSANGRTYQSTQPCPGGGLVYYGPTGSQQQYDAPIPKVGLAPASLKYMTPRCAALNDAIRTGPARGLKYDTINQMRQEYSSECAENESEASSRIAQERNQQRQQNHEAKAAEHQEKERAKLHEQQCSESKRILFSKRARTDLNEGEKAELRRFEENYRNRCS